MQCAAPSCTAVARHAHTLAHSFSPVCSERCGAELRRALAPQRIGPRITRQGGVLTVVEDYPDDEDLPGYYERAAAAGRTVAPAETANDPRRQARERTVAPASSTEPRGVAERAGKRPARELDLDEEGYWRPTAGQIARLRRIRDELLLLQTHVARWRNEPDSNDIIKDLQQLQRIEVSLDRKAVVDELGWAITRIDTLVVRAESGRPVQPSEWRAVLLDAERSVNDLAANRTDLVALRHAMTDPQGGLSQLPRDIIALLQETLQPRLNERLRVEQTLVLPLDVDLVALYGMSLRTGDVWFCAQNPGSWVTRTLYHFDLDTRKISKLTASPWQAAVWCVGANGTLYAVMKHSGPQVPMGADQILVYHAAQGEIIGRPALLSLPGGSDEYIEELFANDTTLFVRVVGAQPRYRNYVFTNPPTMRVYARRFDASTFATWTTVIDDLLSVLVQRDPAAADPQRMHPDSGMQLVADNQQRISALLPIAAEDDDDDDDDDSNGDSGQDDAPPPVRVYRLDARNEPAYELPTSGMSRGFVRPDGEVCIARAEASRDKRIRFDVRCRDRAPMILSGATKLWDETYAAREMMAVDASGTALIARTTSEPARRSSGVGNFETLSIIRIPAGAPVNPEPSGAMRSRGDVADDE